MDLPGVERVTGRVAVALTLAVAGLSVVVGILGIVDPTASFGPVARLVPPAISQTAGFTGALTGFLMVMSAFGLRRGLRAAWYSTLVLLPVTAARGSCRRRRTRCPWSCSPCSRSPCSPPRGSASTRASR